MAALTSLLVGLDFLTGPVKRDFLVSTGIFFSDA
jgi:hypothetical protein